ncbi:GDSL-type esterase/lipase family protein [Lelliottia amnigena]|uniref:GDSL-type esterase/lipase family protein n=1 Tax=Lelliottia amnigena TaxID=61646 RepID=UPI002431A4EF|nr:GDSL-type esterase/lipase family protein [Lelliottia amnigena]
MATIPTQDAVPSESPRDLKFNAGKIDEFVTSLVNTYIDRFGHEHYTIEGLKQLVLQHIYNLGWSLKGTFQGGGTVTAAGDLLQDTTSLIWYRWDDLPTLPKTVPSGSTPASAGGTGVGKWQPVDVADVLRKDLAKTTGATLVNTSDNRNVQEWLIALDSAEYRAKNIRNLTSAHYKLRRKSGLKILCQGDSITAGYDVVTPDSIAPGDDTVSTGDTYRHASMTYPKSILNTLPILSGCPVTVTVRAKSGYTAFRAYNEPGWQTNPNCDIVFLMYAINDTANTDGQTYDSYMANMEKFIRRLINWGMGVVLCSPASGGNGENNPLWQMWGESIRNLASVYGCSYFAAHEIGYNRQYGAIQSDAVHFNSKGYAILAEAMISMLLGGGLLQGNRQISSEVHTWPGKQSDQVGFYDVYSNLVLSYQDRAATLQRIFGGFPNNTPSMATFSFYLDAEAAEIDLQGYWEDNQISIVTDGWYAGSVPTYVYSTPRSSLWEKDYSVQSTGKYLRNRTSKKLDLLPKRAATLIGRGWKTIAIFNNLSGTTTGIASIQGLTIRPIPVHLAMPEKGIQKGFREATMIRLPDMVIGDPGAIPAAFSLSAIQLPLPTDLHPRTNDNRVNYFDTGIAKLRINCKGGTHGNAYLEAVLTKIANNTQYLVTVVSSTGTWPSITARQIGRNMTVPYAVNSAGAGQPIRDIRAIGDNLIDDPVENGYWLALAFDWTSVSGGSKNGYYTVELESSAYGSGAVAMVAV